MGSVSRSVTSVDQISNSLLGAVGLSGLVAAAISASAFALGADMVWVIVLGWLGGPVLTCFGLLIAVSWRRAPPAGLPFGAPRLVVDNDAAQLRRKSMIAAWDADLEDERAFFCHAQNEGDGPPRPAA